MKKSSVFLKKIREISPYNILAILLLAAELTILVVCFRHVFLRIGEAAKDFGLAVGEYGASTINNIFHKSLPVPTPSLAEKSVNVIPVDVPEISVDKFQLFWAAFSDKTIFLMYLKKVLLWLRNASYYLLIFLPAIIVGIVMFNYQFKREKHEIKRSIPLQVVDKIGRYIYQPTKAYVVGCFQYMKNSKFYRYSFLLITLLIFNIPAIGLEALAWYFHLVAVFNFDGFYMAFYKLYADIVPAIQFVPWWAWFAFGIYIFDRVRKKCGYDVLEHHEAMNKGFIASLPIVNFIWGTMGSKKTTLLTDMALSYSAYFRYHAYQTILDCDLLFPDFPWLSFERDLTTAMGLEKGDPDRVYNLRSAKIFARKIFEEGFLYGYTGKTCSEDGLVINDLVSVLEDYAQLYLIFVVQSSLLVSNFGIREDAVFSSLGNFPSWSFDFFHKSPYYSAACSRHSHILNFDMLKLGKRLIANNKDADGFEFGVVCITEIAKERGNQFDLKKLDPKSSCPSQLNDGFNDMLKLARHFASVRHFPYVVFLVDDQRPESLSADVRDLCQLICVRDCTNKKMAMPLHFVDDYIHDWLLSRFESKYALYRFYRADYTLFMMSYKRFVAAIHKRYLVHHNIFEYYDVVLDLEMGTQDSKIRSHPYFLSIKKIYSDRFATDAFGGFVDYKVSRSGVGLNDLPTYEQTKASVAELQSCNSYLIRNITKIFVQKGDRDNVL